MKHTKNEKSWKTRKGSYLCLTIVLATVLMASAKAEDFVNQEEQENYWECENVCAEQERQEQDAGIKSADLIANFVNCRKACYTQACPIPSSIIPTECSEGYYKEGRYDLGDPRVLSDAWGYPCFYRENADQYAGRGNWKNGERRFTPDMYKNSPINFIYAKGEGRQKVCLYTKQGVGEIFLKQH
ncbi:hypothetical protein [Rickettsiella endosymbiont of Dermanyssus gallinae]|uniref:hypothetical protein n=1 Tax=Rickettsiella endosymbiont of Dermanyssus gallinae TaxID=2856608 RepID=UPI001C529ED3|nr:hypothetical protein [Rickettsiella endosymbiont of Dermanyssus gallinae]